MLLNQLSPLPALVTVICGVSVGLCAGLWLSQVIWRVPRGLPMRGAPQSSGSGVPASFSWHFGLITAGVFGVVTVWWLSYFGTVIPEVFDTHAVAQTVSFGSSLLQYLSFAALSITLSAIDIAHHRLPNRIVLSGSLILLCIVIGRCAAAALWGELARALSASALMGLSYLAIRFCRPHSFGAGDVKLAPVIGLILGSSGWDAVVIGTIAAVVGAALWGVLLLIQKRGDTLAFGPWMFAGAWIGILTSPMLVR